MNTSCKLCSSPFVREINEMIASGVKTPAIQSWTAARQLTFDRRTFYKHKKDHVDAVTDFVGETNQQIEDGEIKTVTNDEFLAAIRDRAFAKIERKPDSISPALGLAAVKIMEGRKTRPDVLVLAQIFTGQLPRSTAIEGEYIELPAANGQKLIGVMND